MSRNEAEEVVSGTLGYINETQLALFRLLIDRYDHYV
jgi:hypothetical protein